MGYFDDPRVKQADELAFIAEGYEKQGDYLTASLLYQKAASLEEEMANEVDLDSPRVKEVFIFNAKALRERVEDIARKIRENEGREH